MQRCLKCDSLRVVMHRDAEGTTRHYNCLDCHHHTATVEVPDGYLRNLIERSLELARLQSVAV